MRCEYQYFRIFDFGGFLDIEKARKALEGAFLLQGVNPARGAPEYVSFAPIVAIEFGERGQFEFENGVPCKVSGKVFEMGAISIFFQAQFEIGSLRDLPAYWDFALRRGGIAYRKGEIAKQFYEEVGRKIAVGLLDRYETEAYPESYTLFSLEVKEEPAAEFVSKNRPALAALLINEESHDRLGEREVDEILGSPYSYYRDEISFIDWDAAVTVCADLRGEDDLASVIEAANLQLLELRTYDDYLDRVIAKATDDLRTIFAPGGFFKGRARRMVAELAETRLELEKMVDEINNVAKFFGDWYIARIYLGCRKKLHVDRWLTSVQEKLDSLDDLYELAANESMNRRLLILEAMIVVLFVLDIALILLGGAGPG